MRTIHASDLVERDGVHYATDDRKPYTGRVVGEYYDGQIRFESHYLNGIKNGNETTWYTNGNIHREQSYKNGEPHGEWTSWDREQNLLFHRTYEQGVQVY